MPASLADQIAPLGSPDYPAERLLPAFERRCCLRASGHARLHGLADIDAAFRAGWCARRNFGSVDDTLVWLVAMVLNERLGGAIHPQGGGPWVKLAEGTREYWLEQARAALAVTACPPEGP